MFNQCVFDELIHFVLQTVSSETYLNSLGIYRPSMMTHAKLSKLIRAGRAKPGIYPLDYGGVDSVHYFGVRKNVNTGLVTVGNGYSTGEGIFQSFGLSAQSDHSHGLCQTYALMYYMGHERALVPGKFYYNVLVGLNYLLAFINADYNNRERVWTIRSIKENIEHVCKHNHTKERNAVFRMLCSQGTNEIYLTSIIKNILLNPKYRENLKTWFDEPTGTEVNNTFYIEDSDDE